MGVVGEHVEQMITGVTDSFNNDRCAKGFRMDKALGNFDHSEGWKQFYTGGVRDSGCETSSKKRSSELTIAVDEATTEIQLQMREPSKCTYEIMLVGSSAALKSFT